MIVWDIRIEKIRDLNKISASDGLHALPEHTEQTYYGVIVHT